MHPQSLFVLFTTLFGFAVAVPFEGSLEQRQTPTCTSGTPLCCTVVDPSDANGAGCEIPYRLRT